MTSSSAASALTTDLQTTSWCWSHLADGGEAILSYDGARGRTSLAVRYTVTGRAISIPLEWFNEVGWRAVGAATRLEVSGPLSAELRWVVCVTGLAERGGPSALEALEDARRVHPAHPVSSAGAIDRPTGLRLRSSQVRGFLRTVVPV